MVVWIQVLRCGRIFTSSMVWLVIPRLYGKVGYTEVVWYGRMLSGNIVLRNSLVVWSCRMYPGNKIC